jgi:hypothetical protein
MYNIPYLLYVNSKIGKIEVYQFDIANRAFIKNKQYIDLIPECSHAVHVVDNLLVVHNLDAQFSKLFDFSVKPLTEPVCKNLPMNDRFAIDSYVCDGIQPEFEIDYLDDDDENLEFLITGRKKFVYRESSMYECVFDFT